ncbi:RNA methyltransferase tRNA(m5U54)methyltransferase [Tulasnella sp. 427]|nr:RNA methyltransferase tRNA(m5U54)methyltransferase [Tulasnella sp. 427]
MADSIHHASTSTLPIPPGFKLHTENTAQILLPDAADAFLNPVQEFNRDLSVACIRTWSEDMNAKRKAIWEAKLRSRKDEASGGGKGKGKAKRLVENVDDSGEPESKKAKLDVGIPPEAANAMQVDAPSATTAVSDADPEKTEGVMKAEEFQPTKVIILEALSATGLRSIRYAKEIPLVKYVIANDLSSAATAAMRRNVELNGLGPTDAPDPKPSPGKVHINEGDACDLMYSHRPERSRVDVVDLDPYGTAAPFIDAAVQSVKDDEKKNGDRVNLLYKTAPSAPSSDTCVECGGKLHVAGPMWSGPIHDPDFVKKVLEHVNENSRNYGTHARMKGMLTVASEELDEPFYFTPAKVASHFHCECPSLDETASAILNAGYKISRSHASAGSLKTNAPQSFVHDLMRTWILDHPARMDKIKDEASKTLLNKPIGTKADFTRHPGLEAISNKVKLVRYQVNPQPNWGPGARPDNKKKKKGRSPAAE